jgi:hypothetical protein
MEPCCLSRMVQEMAHMMVYQIHNLAIKSEVPILGAKLKLKASGKNRISIHEIKNYPKKSLGFKKLHVFPGADCFQKLNNFYIYFHKPNGKSALFTHDILPYILAASGLFLFHGSIIQNKNKIFLVLGKSGAGKSTLSLEAIRKKGYCLGDEAAVIFKSKNQWYVEPAISTLRYWPKKRGQGIEKELLVMKSLKRKRILNKVIVLQKKSKKARLRIHKGSDLKIFQELITHLFWPDNLEPHNRRKLFDNLTQFSTSLDPLIVEYPHKRKNQTLVLRELLEF